MAVKKLNLLEKKGPEKLQSQCCKALQGEEKQGEPFHLQMCCKALQSGKATDEVQNAEQSRSTACLGLSKLQPGSHNMHVWSAGVDMVLAAAAAGGSQTLG